uniref:Cytochrome c oxidase subunit 2 n=1 Tax=Ascoschoengastia sp. TATW-1 TaxID=436354 RepID=B3IUN3_9ACAR|nr:cytochrome oxidase subunit 2 [Ascoschoengastia sp. TATW-1]
MPVWSSMFTQNSNSPMMENLLFFHDHIMVILILVLMITGLMGIMSLIQDSFYIFSSESQEMEIFWSTLPSIILLMIAVPSLKLLYFMEENSFSSLSFKVIGHQWYWSYEYSEFSMFGMDSFMISDCPRNLMTDNHLVLPSLTPLRFLLTSTDVIHSWTVPSMGVKMDAVPGRINQFYLNIDRVGISSGQCSEICGMNHSFMPITLSIIPLSDFISSLGSL